MWVGMGRGFFPPSPTPSTSSITTLSNLFAQQKLTACRRSTSCIPSIGTPLHASQPDSQHPAHDAFAGTCYGHLSEPQTLVDARQALPNATRERAAAASPTLINLTSRHDRHRYRGKARELFQLMQHEGLPLSKEAYVTVLSACSRPEDLFVGKLVHANIVDRGLNSDVVVENALLSMYSNCGSLEDARVAFSKMRKRDAGSWTAMIVACVRHGFGEKAFKLFQLMKQESVKPHRSTFMNILRACSRPEALPLGKHVHALIVENGMESSVFVRTALVSMYGKCGSISDAERIFSEMHHRDVVSWTAMIAAYARLGNEKEAFNLFHRMQQEGVKPDKVTLTTILSSCSSPEVLALGKQVHALIVDGAVTPDDALRTALLSMYGNCGSIEDARMVFKEAPQRDVVLWNAMIQACARYGYGDEALSLFHTMQQDGVKPDRITFIHLLNAFFSPEALTLGKHVHALIVDRGIESDIVVGTTLVSMYGKCGSVDDALKTFDKMQQRDVTSWNSIISACASSRRHGDEAFKLFKRMQEEGMKPDRITFISILNACSSPAALELGKTIHALIDESAFKSNYVVGNALVNMYGNCGSLEDAQRVFNNMPERDLTSWNGMIAAYSRYGYAEEAFKLFHTMQQEGMKPDKITFISLLNACSSPKALALGKQVHTCIVDSGMESEVAVGNALVSMYGKCGSIDDAREMFFKMVERDVISWNAMIKVCAWHGCYIEAFKLFYQMQEEGVKPDNITFIIILGTCSSPETLALGKEVHAQIDDSAIQSDVVLGNVLINMYGNCGSIDDACRVFSSMRQQDVVSWTLMIAGFTRHGYSAEALQHFDAMHQKGVKPDKVSYISILSICSSLALGKKVHAHIVDSGVESDVVVGNALVSMYNKCGSIEDARTMFMKMHQRDVVSWNTMISTCAQHGQGTEALELFQQMQREGIKPDKITLTSVLCACSHAKLVDEGLLYFNLMNQEYGITPTVEHCNCIVDLLGRAGRLDEAENFINKMPCRSNAVTWMTLLGSCRIYGCIERGKHAAQRALQLDPKFAAPYVVLSNIYAAAGRWDHVAELRKMLVERGVKKEPGLSWIEVNNRVHKFVVGDRSHPQTVEIYAELKRLSEQIKEAGYVPDIKLVLHDVEDEHKEELLCHHSEKLAIAFGHMSLPSDAPLRIMKNLRVCSDCHTATKFISKTVMREIVLRDANRFHHFKGGECSCGDFW